MDTSSHHLLVIANQTASNEALITELRRRQQARPVVVLLVVPALTTRMHHWLSDTDDATSTTRLRCDETLETMRQAGIRLAVEAGDGDPLSAISDALAHFPADEILISTLPKERSHWLERDIIGRAEARFPVPVTHIVASDQAARPGPMLRTDPSTR